MWGKLEPLQRREKQTFKSCNFNRPTHSRWVGVCYVDGQDIGAAVIAAGHVLTVRDILVNCIGIWGRAGRGHGSSGSGIVEQNRGKDLKKLTFDELFGTGFRWPEDGDDPFDIPPDSRENAALSEDDFSRFVLMVQGYRDSADALVQIALANRGQRDFLVYPILYLYRHALELNLKYIINEYGPKVGVAPIWNTHVLEVLWKKFNQVLDGYGTDNPDKADQVVGGVVAQFANIDKKSFSHRYPCDNKGNPIELVQDEVHLDTLFDVMKGTFAYFTGTDGYLSSLANAE